MAPCRRELFGFKTTDTFGKALAKVRFKTQKKGRRIGLQLALLPIEANISRGFRDGASSPRDLDNPFKSAQSTNNRTRVPVSEPLDIIIVDSNEAQSSVQSDPDKDAHEWLKRRRLEYLFTASRPIDELHICHSLCESNIYKDEGIAAILRSMSRSRNHKSSGGRRITRNRKALPIDYDIDCYNMAATEAPGVQPVSVDDVLEAMRKRFDDMAGNPMGKKLKHICVQAIESYGIYLHAVSKAAYYFLVGHDYPFPRNGCALFDTQEFPARIPAIAYIAQCFYERSSHPCLVVTSSKKRISWIRKCRQMCKDIKISCGPLKDDQSLEEEMNSVPEDFTLFVLTYEQFIKQIDIVTKRTWRSLFVEADLSCLLSTLAPVLPQISEEIRSQSRYLLIQNCMLPRNFDGLEKHGLELLPFFFVDQLQQVDFQEGIKMLIRKLSTPTPESSQTSSRQNFFPSCVSRFHPLLKVLYLNTFHPNMVSRNIVKIHEVDLPSNMPKDVYISELLRPVIPELKARNDGVRTTCIMTLCLEDRRLAETVMVNNGLRGVQLPENQRIPVFPLMDTWHKVVYVLGRYDDPRITDEAVEMFKNSEALRRYGDREIIFLCPSEQNASLEEAQIRFEDDGRTPNLASIDFVTEMFPKILMGGKFQSKSLLSQLDTTTQVPIVTQKVFEAIMNEAMDFSLPATRRPKVRRTNVRHEEIREYLEQVEEKQPELATPRDRPRPPPKRKPPPTKVPPAPSASNPPQTVRRIPERLDRLRRLLPTMVNAVSNLTPFGPPVDRYLFRKYMLDQVPLDVLPMDCYLTAKTVVRFIAFGSYYRHSLYNGQIRKTLAHFFNWECATAFYGIVNRKFPHQKSRIRIYKQFLAKFFKKNMIHRFLKKDGFPLTRAPMEREMLTFMLNNGIVFDFRASLMKTLVDPEGKIDETSLKSEKEDVEDYVKEYFVKKEEIPPQPNYIGDILNMLIEREDQNYWCSLAIRKLRNSNKTLIAKNDFHDFFAEGLYSFLDFEIQRSESVMNEKKNLFVNSCGKSRRSTTCTVRGTAKTASNVYLRKMKPVPPKPAAMDEDALSSGAGPSSNETARDTSTLERPLEDSQMDIDTPLEDSQMPHTPLIERPQVDEDDEVPLSNIPHIGPSCLRYPSYRSDIPFDSFPGRRLAARVYGDSVNLAFGDELLNSFDVNVLSSDSDDEDENVVVRKRNLDEDSGDQIPAKMSKPDDVDSENTIHLEDDLMELDEEIKPEYLKSEFAPTFRKSLRMSFVVAGDLQHRISEFPRPKDLNKDHRYNTGLVLNSDPRRVYDKTDFTQPLSLFSNFTLLAEDSTIPNNDEVIEDVLNYYSSMQQNRKLYNNHDQLASDLDPVNIDWDLRKYFELAVTSRMPDNLSFSFDNSCLNMPIYGRTLPKDAKIEILPHGVDNSSGKAYLSPFHSAPHMAPISSVMPPGISSPFKPIPSTSVLHAPPSNPVLDSSELHHLLLRKLGYEQDLPEDDHTIKVERQKTPLLKGNDGPVRNILEEENGSQGETNGSGIMPNEPVTSRQPESVKTEGALGTPLKSETSDSEATTNISLPYRSQIGLQERIIESPQKSESTNEKFKPKGDVMYSPQPGTIFELIENIADKYPDWVELLTNKDEASFPPTLLLDVVCRIFKDELQVKDSSDVELVKQHLFPIDSEVWKPFVITVFADRAKITTSSKERFLEKNHLLLLQRSFSRNELITILKQCEIKYGLNVSGMLQNPKRMTQYDIRIAASQLKNFAPRAKLRELNDDIDYSIRRRRTQLQRSQSLEPPKYLKSYIRRRSASFSYSKETGIRVFDPRMELPSKQKQRYVFKTPKPSVFRPTIKKPESYVINFSKMLGNDGEKTGASSYHCRRFRRRIYVAAGNVRWRYSSYIDDRWKNFRIRYKSSFSLGFNNYCQMNGISNQTTR